MNYSNVTCQVCGKQFNVMTWKLSQGRGKTCSIACRREFQKKFVSGEANQRWKGGQFIRNGYKLILSKNHPNRNNYGYVREHRLVMEKHLGRYLLKKEAVHHINGNRLDNRLENLKLASDNSEHMGFHKSNIKCPCGELAVSLGMCSFHYQRFHKNGSILDLSPRKRVDKIK